MARLVRVVLLTAFTLLIAQPALAQDAGLDLALSTGQTTYVPGERVVLTATVTNKGTAPCQVATIAAGSVQVAAVTRDGKAVASQLGAAYHDRPLVDVVRGSMKTVQPGDAVSFRLGSASAGPDGGAEVSSTDVLPTGRGLIASRPLTETGAYVVSARYAAPPFGGLEPAPCAGTTKVATVTFAVGSSEPGFPWLWVSIGVGALLLVAALFLILRRVRGRAPAAGVVLLLLVAGMTGAGVNPAEAKLEPVPMPPEHASEKSKQDARDFAAAVSGCMSVFTADASSAPDIKIVTDWLNDPSTTAVRIVPHDGNSFARPYWVADLATGEYVWGVDPKTGKPVPPVPYAVEVGWDRSWEGEFSNGAPFDSCSTLFHELVHAWSMGHGLDYDWLEARELMCPYTKSELHPEGDEATEIRATLAENSYRRLHGLKERDGYGSKPAPPSLGDCESDPAKVPPPDRTHHPVPPGKPGPRPAQTLPNLPNYPAKPPGTGQKTKGGFPGRSQPPGVVTKPFPIEQGPGGIPQGGWDGTDRGSVAPPVGGGGSDGDPHLTTLDHHSYDFQAVGEFTVVRSTGGDLEIQSRQTAIENDRTVSVNSAVATRIGPDRVTFTMNGGDVVLRVNGEPTTLARGERKLPGGGTVLRRGSSIMLAEDGYTVRWPDGSSAWLDPLGRWGLRLYVSLVDGRKGQAAGLLGNFDGNADNDLTTKDGKPVSARPSFEQLYRTFGESWRISQADSLFDYAPGESTEKFTDRALPEKEVKVDDLPVEQRDQARGACTMAGVRNPALMDGCILDVALTGQPIFAVTGGNSQRATTIPTTPPDPPPGEPLGPLRDGSRVTSARHGDYQLDLGGATDFELADVTGDITTQVACPGQNAEHVLIGVHQFRLPTPANCRLTVTGTGGSYGFRLVTLKHRALPAKIGDRITGSLDVPGRVDTYRIDAVGEGKIVPTDGKPCEGVTLGVSGDGERPRVFTPHGACYGLPIANPDPDKPMFLVVWSDNAEVVDYTFRLETG
ncbi:VWD domain-containing protein [Amycolatopsis speibonae]|uniref:VWD domain-containing protein n=1 Tax=Amycolatopsis speibonae TaxID=1450224 RepID=A0ABV7P393_9PSEU